VVCVRRSRLRANHKSRLIGVEMEMGIPRFLAGGWSAKAQCMNKAKTRRHRCTARSSGRHYARRRWDKTDLCDIVGWSGVRAGPATGSIRQVWTAWAVSLGWIPLASASAQQSTKGAPPMGASKKKGKGLDCAQPRVFAARCRSLPKLRIPQRFACVAWRHCQTFAPWPNAHSAAIATAMSMGMAWACRVSWP
jgi:hypothetical protein